MPELKEGIISTHGKWVMQKKKQYLQYFRIDDYTTIMPNDNYVKRTLLQTAVMPNKMMSNNHYANRHYAKRFYAKLPATVILIWALVIYHKDYLA